MPRIHLQVITWQQQQQHWLWQSEALASGAVAASLVCLLEPVPVHTRDTDTHILRHTHTGIHCGVEVTELSTNKQHTLSHKYNTHTSDAWCDSAFFPHRESAASYHRAINAVRNDNGIQLSFATAFVAFIARW
jgi:hypothetical protein